MTEQREQIADAAIAWARAVQRYEDAYAAYLSVPLTWEDESRRAGAADETFRRRQDEEYARQNLLQACGKVGA